MHLFKLTDEQLAQILIPKRFVPPTPPHLKHNLIGNEFGLRKIQFKFNLTGTLKNG